MELKEFVNICIDKAETAYDHGDLEESIRLLTLATETMKKQVDGLVAKIEEKRKNEARST